MEQARLDDLHRWFEHYVSSYYDIDDEGRANIQLKVDHTRRVCQVMDQLTAAEGFPPEEARLAAAIALLHDVGRFPQYRRWRTFRDSESDNHARLSVEVVASQGALDDLPEQQRSLIEQAVRFHNLLEVPQRLTGPEGRFLRLIRDADKLDIWRVFLDYFRQPADQRPSAVGLGLPDRPELSPACVESLAAGRIVRLDAVATLNDFKLLQISWVYDLNYPAAFRLLMQRGYLQELADSIPLQGDAATAVAQALSRAQAEVSVKAGVTGNRGDGKTG